MQQPQRRIERRKQILPCDDRTLAVRILQFRLHPLDVPVAEVAPKELVHTLGRFMEPVVAQRNIY